MQPSMNVECNLRHSAPEVEELDSVQVPNIGLRVLFCARLCSFLSSGASIPLLLPLGTVPIKSACLGVDSSEI